MKAAAIPRPITDADLERKLTVDRSRLLLAAYRRANPADPTATDLDRWSAFEAANPSAFRGMYQFWLQRPPVSLK